MDPNLECCVLGCHTRPNQGLRFYRFPCNNSQISSIWQQRICQSANNDFDILNNHVCELHFDYRCKTGNECALDEGSLPTLHLPSFGNLSFTGSAQFQMNANIIEEPSYKISIDTISYHCRFCLRRGLLYEVETSTYRSKSFLSLIDLPANVLPDNTQPNACLSCLKSIVIAHQLSIAVEHSNTILQLLRLHPKQSKVVSSTNFFDIKSELDFCNLILANTLSMKLEIEIEDNVVCANEDYEQKWVGTEESTSPAVYFNTQNFVDKPICIAEKQENVSKMHDSVTANMHCPKEFPMFAIGPEYTTKLSAERIPDASKNSDFCVLIEHTDDNSEVMVSNKLDDSCAKDRQFANEQAPISMSKALNEPTYNLCKFTTNYKANIAIHKNMHLVGNVKVQCYCQKCEKDFLLRRHFVRHNTIVYADDFICKICDEPLASATKLIVHYTEQHHLQCDISLRVLGSGHPAHMLDHKQGMTTFTTIDKTHRNENDDVYNRPICEWKSPSPNSINAHMGKQEQSEKDSAIGSKESETLKTHAVRNADGRYQCSECPKAFRNKCDFIRHLRIHSNERPYKCTECSKAFRQKTVLDTHRRIHTKEKPYKCNVCPKTFSDKSSFNTHKRVHLNERLYKCIECPKTFKHKNSLVTHRRIHTNERPYKCAECPKTFSDTSAFNIHKRIHRNERPYKCTKCPKTFKHKNSLVTHRRIHTNERPYECAECPKTFSDTSPFNIHKRIHTNEKRYKCTECPKTFKHKNSLNTHRRKHTNERPYKCAECSKTFNDTSTFNIHKRIHTNERPYKCTECPKTFRHKGSLITHRRIHTNEKPYKCSECSKTFRQKGGLDIHMRTHE